MAQEIYANMRQRIDTAAAWAAENPVLGAGEIGIVAGTEPRQFKIGDGVTAWNALSFANGGGTTINSIDDIDDVFLARNQPASDGRALIVQNNEIISGPVIGGVSYTVSSTFDPLSLGSSLRAWYDASDPASVTITSGKVSQWNDKSGNSRHVSQADASDRPEYATAVFSGKNALLWPNANNGCFLRNTSSVDFKEVFVVCQYVSAESPNNFGQYATTVSGYSAIITTGLGTGFYTTNMDEFYLNGNNTTNRSSNAFPTIKSLSLLRANKSSAGAVTDGTGIVIGLDREYSDSSNVFLNRGWMGYICEVLVLSSTVNTTTRLEIEYYLASKWGFAASLPVDHPGVVPIEIPYSIGLHDDVDIATDPPQDKEPLVWDSAQQKFVPGQALIAKSLANTQTGLAVDAGANFTIAAGNVFNLLSVNCSHPAWIRVYSSSAARDADARTQSGAPYPNPGSGFVAEALTTSLDQTVSFSPVAVGQGSTGNAFVRVVNKHNATANMVSTFSVLTLS